MFVISNEVTTIISRENIHKCVHKNDTYSPTDIRHLILIYLYTNRQTHRQMIGRIRKSTDIDNRKYSNIAHVFGACVGFSIVVGICKFVYLFVSFMLLKHGNHLNRQSVFMIFTKDE